VIGTGPAYGSIYGGSAYCSSTVTSTASSGTTSNAGSGTAHGHIAAEGTKFEGNAVASLPFYIALCYIQKI
jgi:hypothetical protein